MLQSQRWKWLESMNKILVVCLIVISLLSCSKSDGYKKKLNVDLKNVEPRRLEVFEYNKALFSIDTADFEAGIQSVRPQFCALLGDTLEMVDIMFVKDFVTDTFVMKINELVEETFPDSKAVSDKVKGVYQHLKYYYPEISLPSTFTYISGINFENGPVMISPEAVMISLDFYLSNKDLVYDKVGMPRYVSRRCQPASLPKDLAESLYYTYCYDNIKNRNVMMEMISRGKKYYFIEAMDPSMNDSILLGYSSQQTEWAKDNEGQIWATIIGNNMLYANGFEQYRVLFNDGPFTAAFSDAAPARLGDFIGLQIIRSFMSNNDESLQELLKMTDYQDILQRSQYKPRK